MKPFILGAYLVAAVSAAWAQSVQISDPWVRGTVAQQKATGAFMRLTADQPMRLVAASSPVAGVVEIHEMTMEQGVMRMRAIPGLELPAKQPVELKPGGYHVMLMDLKQPVAPGSTVPLTLVFETADKRRIEQSVQAPVRALAAPAGQSMGEHQHQHDHGGHKH
jgi:copper(I)-binding protein